MSCTAQEFFKDILPQILDNSQKQHIISEKNIFQEGNSLNRQLVISMVEKLMLPQSQILSVENMVELYHKAQAGSSCLLLVEHYSNLDLPCFYSLLTKSHPLGEKIADAIIAIAGVKLNEANPNILAIAEAFSRIIIYPSRSIEGLPDGPEKETELKRAQSINLAAMKALSSAKSSGKLILVFPAGTRYRPDRPETKRGVKEIDSYIRGFDYMCLIGINGCVLQTSSEQMYADIVSSDLMLYTVSPVIECKEFRKNAQAACPAEQDPKQFVVDQIMAFLDNLHHQTEVVRQKLLSQK